MTSRGRMRQTTVRFSEELWQQLEREAERSGVSAAQYVRDATLTRLSYMAGQRGEGMFGNRAAAQAADASEWAQARNARDRARSVRDEAV